MSKNQALVDQIYRCLKKESERYPYREMVILESQQPDHPESIQTYIAAFPKRKLEIRGEESEWTENGKSSSGQGNPWEQLKMFREKSALLFGYIGYDLAADDKDGKSKNKPLVNAPDLFMMEPSVLFRVKNGKANQILGDKLEIDTPYFSGYLEAGSLKPGISKTAYKKRIRHIQEMIREGDFYELNFSYPLESRFAGDCYELYRKMRQVNPVPFGSYIEMDDLAICCSSPERFLKKTGRKLVSEPIKGTAARGENEEEDDAFKSELKSEKNKAENLMIVDLVRHDLARVCETGSIHVSKLFEVQTFGTVHQLISRVEGTIREDIDPVDAIKFCFPMGSMTGAPKIRVMKRIRELEKYKRGIYSGAIGYFMPDQTFDFNVVIRTAILQGKKLVYPVGGAITGDSDPEEEWQETIVKSKVLRSVLND